MGLIFGERQCLPACSPKHGRGSSSSACCCTHQPLCINGQIRTCSPVKPLCGVGGPAVTVPERCSANRETRALASTGKGKTLEMGRWGAKRWVDRGRRQRKRKKGRRQNISTTEKVSEKEKKERRETMSTLCRVAFPSCVCNKGQVER